MSNPLEEAAAAMARGESRSAAPRQPNHPGKHDPDGKPGQVTQRVNANFAPLGLPVALRSAPGAPLPRNPMGGSANCGEGKSVVRIASNRPSGGGRQITPPETLTIGIADVLPRGMR